MSIANIRPIETPRRRHLFNQMLNRDYKPFGFGTILIRVDKDVDTRSTGLQPGMEIECVHQKGYYFMEVV